MTNKKIKRNQEKRRERDNEVKKLHEENKKLKQKIKSLTNLLKREKSIEEPILKKEEKCPSCKDGDIKKLVIKRSTDNLELKTCKCGYRSSKKI